jgi:hypothetical protein
LEVFNLNKKKLKKKLKSMATPEKQKWKKNFFQVREIYCKLELYKWLSSFIDQDQSDQFNFKLNWTTRKISKMSKSDQKKEFQEAQKLEDSEKSKIIKEDVTAE